MTLKSGKRSKRRAKDDEPEVISTALAGRIFEPVPIYHGTMFHTTERLRGIPASAVSSKKFFAVSSGLLREINPERTAFAPGASSRNNTSAFTPASQGSKSGMDAPSPASCRRRATKSLNGLMCGACNPLALSRRANGSANDFGRSMIGVVVFTFFAERLSLDTGGAHTTLPSHGRLRLPRLLSPAFCSAWRSREIPFAAWSALESKLNTWRGRSRTRRQWMLAHLLLVERWSQSR